MKNNRLGILLIISSLVVIAIVVGLLLKRQATTQATQVRIQGVGVTRSLAALPMTILAPKGGGASVLQSLLVSFENPDFGYAAVTSVDGKLLSQVTRPGTLVPSVGLPTHTASLFGERTLAGTADEGTIREFYGPAMDGDQLGGFIRVGYFEPNRWLTLRDLPFFAVLALAMFLLVPLFFFLVKRELAPLGTISRRLQESLDSPQIALSPQVDMRSLVDKLQRYVETTTSRIRDLEEEGTRSATSGRLLEYSSTKLNAVLQCLPDGLLILDPTGEVTYASSKIEPLLGVQISDVLSRPVDTWCGDTDLRTLFSRYRSDSQQNGRQITVEFSPVKVPDKRLLATGQPLVGGLGTLAFGTLIVLRDATHEHLTRQAGSDFVANVSHELKSPLNVISMYSEMLQTEGAHDESLRIEATNVIQDEIERMNALVGNLLNVSKIETGSMHPQRQRVRLDDLLQDVFNHALPRAQSKSISMDLQLPRELSAVSIDKDLFRIALNNLLTNAIKYSDAGASVILVAEDGDNDIIITVRDTGIGIAVEDQTHIFEKFYRAQEAGGSGRSGHGLGLYLSNQIIELHHGRITVDSTVGRGSAFSIHLKKSPLLVQGVNAL